MSKKYLAYTRVSCPKQYIQGVSIEEQKRVICQYAAEKQLTISDWYEEVESAAGNRRKLFREIIQLLRKRKSVGLIMHKVDRGVRNIRDWADIGELIDAGVDNPVRPR